MALVSLINTENTGFGTYNSAGAKELFDYVKDLFTAVQLGPCGKTKLSDSSPYTGTVFSKNPLFINLKELTTSKWDKILSQKTLDKIIEMNPNKGTNRAAYAYAVENVELAANEFYKNFKKKASEKLQKEFASFKKENAFWLDQQLRQFQTEDLGTLVHKGKGKVGGAGFIFYVELLGNLRLLGHFCYAVADNFAHFTNSEGNVQ